MLMDEKQHKELDVSRIFKSWAQLSWEDQSFRWAELPQSSALEICDVVAAAYNDLPDTQRFHICAGPREREHIRISNWTDWRENMGCQYAEFYMLSKETMLVQNILYKAGISQWLTWLDGFSDHTLAVALLLNAHCNKWDLIYAFEFSCGMKDADSIRTILFCFLVSKDQSEIEQDAFLSTVCSHYELLSGLCLEVLSDFRFQISYPKKDLVYQAIAAMCAKNEMLDHLSASPVMTIGILSAWAELLSRLNPTQEQLNQFKTAYWGWVSTTNDYMLTTNMNGKPVKREIDFLNFLINLFAFDSCSVEKLKNLWEKKVDVYYRWNDAKKHSRQQWFQHIGLVLWYAGVAEYKQNRSKELAIYVLKRMNDAIPMMLTEHDYSLLLCNVFCVSFEKAPEINSLLSNLIHKIYELSLLCDVILNYMEVDNMNVDILYAMQDRLQMMYKLPHEGLTNKFKSLAEELLDKIKSILN